MPEALCAPAGRCAPSTSPALTSAALGALMMHFMLETILAARLLGVDPFDQPAVELAKVITRERVAALNGVSAGTLRRRVSAGDASDQ